MSCLRSILLWLGSVFISFSAFGQFTLNGNAVSTGNDCYRLTTSQPTLAGSVWYNTLIDLNQSFTSYFTVNLGNRDGNGADGMAFVLQNQNTSIGSVGGGLGYQGINPSFAIEFDTYQNASDPFFDHVAIQRNGDLNHNGPNNLAGPVQAIPSSTNIEDGNPHTLKIDWNINTLTLEVYLDCSLRLSYTGDIVQQIFQGNSLVFWGFTAATGALFNNHSFCVDYISFDQQLNDTTLCLGDSVSLMAKQGLVYAWSPAAGLSDPSIQNPVATPTSTTTYTSTVTDICGQIITDQVTITIVPPASVSLPDDTTVCQGTPVPVFPTATNATDFLWNTGDITPTLTANQPGLYYVDVWNAVCPQPARDSMEIFWSAPLQVNLPADDTLCVGDSMVLVGITPGASGYQWSTGDSTPAITIGAPGPYTLTVSSQYCPPVADQFVLHTQDSLSLELGADQRICEIDTINFTASHPLATSVIWNTGAQTPEIAVFEAGTYIAEIAGRFCPAVSDSVSVSVARIPQVELGADHLICEGDSVVLDASSPDATDYGWTPLSNNPVLVARLPGTYTVSISNPYCPSVSDAVTIELEYPLGPASLPDSVLFCAGDYTGLDGRMEHATAYQWSTGAQQQSIAPNSAGWYTVTGRNQSCGSRQDSVYVDFSLPMADFSYFTDPVFTDILVGEPVFFVENSRLAENFRWHFPDQFEFESGPEVMHQFLEEGVYPVRLTVTDTLGLCEDSITQEITIFPPTLYVPNAFTPNQDGDNDTWQIKGTGILEMDLQIYNRWGLQVFAGHNLADGWDGRARSGAALPEGVYTYQLQGTFQSGRIFQRAGTITLIR